MYFNNFFSKINFIILLLFATFSVLNSTPKVAKKVKKIKKLKVESQLEEKIKAVSKAKQKEDTNRGALVCLKDFIFIDSSLSI